MNKITQILSCYEPELFPGLILRIENSALLIFGPGKFSKIVSFTL